MKQRKPKRGATNLTVEQLAAYSTGWREFFNWLLDNEYSVHYEYGVLHITGHGAKMEVQTIRKHSQWQMQMFGASKVITRKSHKEDQIREQIKYWLPMAKQHHQYRYNPARRWPA